MAKNRDYRRPKTPKQVIFRVQLTLDAKGQLLNETADTGITQIAIMSKLVEWFAAQPDAVQAAILGLYPPSISADVARLILPRLK
jgi:hypothetical protein